MLLKGGHSVGSCNDLLCADGEMIWISGERIVTNNTHGTGCTLSSAIASLLAQGMPLEKSVRSAKTYITQAIAPGCLWDTETDRSHTIIVFTDRKELKIYGKVCNTDGCCKAGNSDTGNGDGRQGRTPGTGTDPGACGKGYDLYSGEHQHKSLHPYGIGEGLRTKMNVNLGISGDCHDYTAEFEKVKLAIQFQCEAIMDLSNYGKTHTFRKQLIEMSPAMIGTVPMYDAIGYLEKDLADIKATDFLKVTGAHAKEGVDFQTIHAGINRRAVEALKRQKRTTNIVSRGGSLLFAGWK